MRTAVRQGTLPCALLPVDESTTLPPQRLNEHCRNGCCGVNASKLCVQHVRDIFFFFPVCVSRVSSPLLTFFLSALDIANVCCAGCRHAQKQWSFLHEMSRCVSPTTLVFLELCSLPAKQIKKYTVRACWAREQNVFGTHSDWYLIKQLIRWLLWHCLSSLSLLSTVEHITEVGEQGKPKPGANISEKGHGENLVKDACSCYGKEDKYINMKCTGKGAGYRLALFIYLFICTNDHTHKRHTRMKNLRTHKISLKLPIMCTHRESCYSSNRFLYKRSR